MYIHYKRGVLGEFYHIVKNYEWRNLNQDFTLTECCWMIPGTYDCDWEKNG